MGRVILRRLLTWLWEWAYGPPCVVCGRREKDCPWAAWPQMAEKVSRAYHGYVADRERI